MIVSRFNFYTKNFVIRSNQVTKIFRSGHDCTSTSSARSPCYFRLQADITIWVLRKVRVDTVLTRTCFHFCSLGLDTTDTCIVHKQTNKGHATTKTDLTERRKKQQRHRVASARGKEQPRERGSIDKLDYASRFVHVIPTFSQHCRKTVTQLNRSLCGRCKHGVVVKRRSSQHISRK